MKSFVAKGSSLGLLTVIDYGTPFVRMLMMSHRLPLHQLGLASLLTATYATFEAISDFTLHRFVYAQPRERYHEALAAAHALSVLRGVAIAVVTFVAAPFIATLLSADANWLEFALLGLVVLIRSFENISPKIAERNYQYGVQLKVSAAANGSGLVALAIALCFYQSGAVVIVSLLAHTISEVVTSHRVADAPYRINFRSPLFREAFRFGYPLIFNAIGMAASSQGDRFIVGGMLGLSTLGVYTVAILAASMPVMMATRPVTTVLLAALYNGAQHSERLYVARLRLAARAVPAFAAVLAIGILTLYNIVVPLVFGRQFTLPPVATAILAFAMFLRLTRSEPFTTMLLNQGRTRRVAGVNLASISALAFAALLTFVHPSIQSMLVGRLLGEAVGLGAALFLTRSLFRSARPDYAASMAVSVATIAVAIALSMTTGVGVRPIVSVAALAGLTGALALWLGLTSRGLLREGFP